MESPEAVSSGFLPLPPKPPDPDLDVMLLVDPPVPPVPPDPPSILIDASVLSVQPLLMHPLLAEADLSSSLTTRRVSLLQLIPVSKPRNLVSCGEHVSFKSSLRKVPYYQQEAGVIEISLLQALYCYVQFSVKAYPSFETLVTCCWTHLPLLHAFARRSLFPCKQEIMLFLNGSLPRIEDVISSSIFKFKLSLPQNEDVIWTSVFVAMYAIVSGLNIWLWRLASQQSIFWKRFLVASEFVDVSYPVGYVENFLTWSANGKWIVSSTQSTETVTLQKAPHSTFSSGFSSFQILADSIVLFFSLRSGLVLIEITGSFIVRNLVPLVIPLSCCYNLCTTFCLVVVAFAMGGVPKLCSSSTLLVLLAPGNGCSLITVLLASGSTASSHLVFSAGYLRFVDLASCSGVSRWTAVLTSADFPLAEVGDVSVSSHVLTPGSSRVLAANFLGPLLMHPLLAEANLSSSLTTRRVSLLHPVSKPRNLVSCREHVSFKSSLRKVPYYQQEAGVIEISVARFLGLLTADCKFTRHFKFSRTGLRMLKFWRCSQSKHILHLKPWSHVVGPISPCFMLTQGMVFISYWSESFVFDHCLREEFNYLSRRSLFPCKQEIMLFLNGSLPRIEDVISSSIFKFKLSLPQNEDVIWTSVFVAMYAIVSGLNIWPWWLASQQSIFWKRCLVASEFVDVSYPIGYVENFPTWSANGTWIVSSTQSTEAVTLQKAPHSTFSSGFSSLQILADSIVLFFALRTLLLLLQWVVSPKFVLQVLWDYCNGERKIVSSMDASDESKLNCSVKFEVSDCTSKHYPDISSPLCTSKYGNPALFRTFFNLLKPGGKVLISDSSRSPKALCPKFSEYINRENMTSMMFKHMFWFKVGWNQVAQRLDIDRCINIKVHALPWECRSQDARIFRQVSGTAGSLTKIGQASMNQDLTVVSTKPCLLLFDLYPRILRKASLEDCRLQVPFEFFYWNLYESSLNGFSHQVLFKLLLTRS
ncbi:hypothetical protein F2Q69_00041846 [Brassica cretica]|uniref:Methyltransferase type 11 domain-containing protein n=1 Tax=Brassica cretica TaxID=69181 RepID=A0A8S9NRB0_BRACR|nr:hypothetical protein F2Q69_00041846 [Brassica cretica]